MGNGFKRLMDFSPLSIKRLNDQLEQLWLKVMGGITYRDLDSGTKDIIDSKLDEEQVVSVVEQSSSEILMAVGRPGGDNIVKNGNGGFGLDGWLCNGVSVGQGYFHIQNGYMGQYGVKVTGDSTYTLGFEGYGGVSPQAVVMGQYAGQSAQTDGIGLLNKQVQASGEYTQHRFSFDVPSSVVSCYVKIQAAGEYRIRKIYLREGENVSGYTSNPNEIDGNGISISDGGINISTSHFNLDIKDANGNVKSILSAEGTDFDRVMCSNISIGERDYYSDTQDGHIYVNSVSGNDMNSGESTYYPLKTINKALKKVPMHIRGNYSVHLTGGEYHENVIFNYGGMGKLTILGESAKLYGRIVIESCGYNLVIQSLKVYAGGGMHCFYLTGNSGFLTLISCLLDCNGVSGSSGIYLTSGARAYMRQCEVNNCGYAFFCTRSAYLDIFMCKGRSNSFSIYAEDLAIANVEGTVPIGNIINMEEEGGRIDGNIIAGVVGSDYTIPGDAIKTSYFNATGAFTYNGSGYVNNRIIQGKGNRGMLVFNTASMSSTLRGKVIKSVKLIVRRRNDDELTYDGILRVFAHNNPSMGSGYGYVEEYGSLTTIKRGEEVSVSLPLTFISRVIAGTAKGVMFYDDSQKREYYIELNASFASKLEVVYV